MTLKSDNMIPRTVLDSFSLPLDSFEELSGGSGPVFRVGDAVLKKIHATSFESNHSLELAPWLQEQLVSILTTSAPYSQKLRHPKLLSIETTFLCQGCYPFL